MILRPGDHVTFTADVLWRLYRRSFYDNASLLRISAITATRFGRLPATVSDVTPPV